MFIQIKKHSPKFIDKCFKIIVIRLGFEPKTHSLEGCCSIQLSYRTILDVLSCKIKAILRIKKICWCVFTEKSGCGIAAFLELF